MPFNVYTIVGGSIIRSSGDTKTTLLINGLSNILNIVIDIVLVFGIGPFPPLGLMGTALGTALSKVVSSSRIRSHLKREELDINLVLISDYSYRSEFLYLAVPSPIERLLMRVGQVVYFGMILTIGVNTYAAHMLVGSIETFNYMPGYGLAAAVTILVGKSIGEDNIENAIEYNRVAMIIAFVVIGTLGSMLFIGSGFLANLFSNESAIIEK